MKIQALAQHNGFSYLVSSPLWGAPEESKALVNHPGESSAHFFQRCEFIISVGEDHIHVVHLESLETAFGAFDDVLSWETDIVYLGRVSCEESLSTEEQVSSHYDVFSLNFEIFERLTK